DRGLLWRGNAASKVKKLRLRYMGPLTDVERAFLDAVVRFEISRARRFRAAVIGGLLGLSAIVIVTMIAFVTIQKSRSQANDTLVQAQENLVQNQRKLVEMEQKEHDRGAREEALRDAGDAGKIAERSAPRGE